MSNLFGITVSGGGEFKPIDEGTYDAVLHAIIQNGTHKREFKGEEKTPANMIKLLFEIPELKREDGTSQIVGKEMPSLMSERANFFKFLKAMGIVKEPTDEELGRAFGTKEAIESILGTAVSVEIAHFETKEGKTVHYLEGVRKLDPRVPQPKATLEPYIFTFADPDIEVFKNKLNKYGRERIMHSLNVKNLPKAFHEAYITEQEAAKEDKKDDKGKGVI